LRTLKLGSKGVQVKRWQTFLRGQGEPVVESGNFDQLTHVGTKSFQKKNKLFDDGVVGNETIGKAAILGFEVVSFIESDAPDFPSEPTFTPLTSNAERQKLFGPLEFVSDPTKENPEQIEITNGWAQANIGSVLIPNLVGKKNAPKSGNVAFNKKAIKSLAALFKAWDAAGLTERILTWDGGFVPRYVRGSRTVLSNHAFGTAFDINAEWNARGTEPAWLDEKGSVFELVPLAHVHGFYWGGHFKDKRDGMHFEWAGG
jgi:hypothetical protein